MLNPRAGIGASLLILLAVLPAGCVPDEPTAEAGIGVGASVPFSGDRLVALPRPPILAATDSATLASARLNAARTRWEDLYRRPDAELVSVEALPFLNSTAEGRRFLAAEGGRALARGMPAESCPAAAAAVGGQRTGTDELVGQALQRCLARLEPRHADCGCRVLAVNDFLTVPRAEMSYARGTTARLRVPALGVDEVLVAEGEGETTLIRDPAGAYARLVRLPDDRVRVTLLRPRRSFEGRRIAVGYRRGRVAERIYATDAAGARMSLLIGFPPRELAAGAAAWLAWPGES